MNRKNIWMALFGTVGLFGLNMGFWVSMAAVTLTMVVMNVAFLGMKPRKKVTEEIKSLDRAAAWTIYLAGSSQSNRALCES